MKYIIATHNLKKRNEIRRILEPVGIEVYIAEELGVELSDVDETGSTFAENALLKAESGCKESGLPCIADDSGLCVDFLDGAPGVYSARYANDHGNDSANMDKLLLNMKDAPEGKRTARFTCSVCCVFPEGRVITAEGTCEGKISFERKGNGGFGYDPVFLPDAYEGKRSMAQLTPDEKDAISHRHNALVKLAELLKKI